MQTASLRAAVANLVVRAERRDRCIVAWTEHEFGVVRRASWSTSGCSWPR